MNSTILQSYRCPQWRAKRTLVPHCKFVSKLYVSNLTCPKQSGFGSSGGFSHNVRFKAPETAKFRQVRAQFSRRGSGGDNGSDTAQSLVNLALTGAFIYLAATGGLGWLFDAIFSIWLFLVIAPIVGFAVYFWYLERQILKGNCPNCGNDVQILKFAVNETPQLCPYCSQPFKVENEIFVRDRKFSGVRGGSFDPQGSGTVVDVEAEVLDD